MTWDEFVVGWAVVYDGYDMRYAPAPRRRLLGVTYRVGRVLAGFGVRPGSLMLISVMCSLAVPLLAYRGGSWAAAALLAMLAGLGADTLGSALTVLTGRVSRLSTFYQALAERVAEICWLCALALLGARPGLIVVVAMLVWMHEYVRARVGAAALRPTATTTVGDRSTRTWLVLAALLVAALSAQVGNDLAAGAVTLVVVTWLALAMIGIGQLLGIIRKVLA
ncbi:MAG TPA: CDP-alcohol phosphatidyltransferase [Micromonosporaceae bacterium]|nr:CDP-alcohol phosphatidyltransferase [Micromonosporaceae bacterium]